MTLVLIRSAIDFASIFSPIFDGSIDIPNNCLNFSIKLSITTSKSISSTLPDNPINSKNVSQNDCIFALTGSSNLSNFSSHSWNFVEFFIRVSSAVTNCAAASVSFASTFPIGDKTPNTLPAAFARKPKTLSKISKPAAAPLTMFFIVTRAVPKCVTYSAALFI